MRFAVSLVIAFTIFGVIGIIGLNGGIIWSDYWTGLCLSLTAIALGVIYWGLRPKINHFFAPKKNENIQRTETGITKESSQGIQNSVKGGLFQSSLKEPSVNNEPLLPESNNLENHLNNDLLDDLYDKASQQAIALYHDAKLARINMDCFPFLGRFSFSISFTFHSKFARRTCTFNSYDFSRDISHIPPDKHVQKSSTFNNLPWKDSPHWLEFVNRAYTRVKPLSSYRGTHYTIDIYSFLPDPWRLKFIDGFNGNEFEYCWDGKGIDEKNIKEISN